MTALDRDCASRLLALRETLRAEAPLVHCLTNQVTVNFVANALLAAGASPAMTDHPAEAGDLASAAGALLINLGTPNESSLAAMRQATQAAERAGTPWVLDPVGAAALPLRREISLELMHHGPSVIRGNGSEIRSLARAEARGHGVDTRHTAAEGVGAARQLLAQWNALGGVAISGSTDHLLGRGESAAVDLFPLAGGSAWQPRVTGTGCALGALVAAYLAISEDPMDAMLIAHAHAAAAAEQAETQAKGPGSFASAWLDALDGVELEPFLLSRIDSDAQDRA